MSRGRGSREIVLIFGSKLIKHRAKIHSKSLKNRIAKGKFRYRRSEIEKQCPSTVRHRWAQEKAQHVEAKIGPKSNKHLSKFIQKSKFQKFAKKSRFLKWPKNHFPHIQNSQSRIFQKKENVFDKNLRRATKPV